MRFAPAQNGKLAELPDDLVGGRDGFFFPQDEAVGIVLEKHVSVKAAAGFSGYNVQYLRRLLRNGHLEGIKIGQIWLIKMTSLETYSRNGQMVGD